MNTKFYVRRAKEAISAAETPPARIAFLYSFSIFALQALINGASVAVESIETDGLSASVKLIGFSGFLDALWFFLVVFSGIWSICFSGYAFSLLSDPRADRSTLLNQLGSFWRYLGIRFRIFMKQILWTVLFSSAFVYLYSFVFFSTQVSAEELETLTDYSAVTEYLTNQITEKTAQSLFIWYTVIILASYAIAFFVTYRFRFAKYFAIVSKMPALVCLRLSAQTLKGSKLFLLRLDFSFLWFYLLSFLPSGLLFAVDSFFELSNLCYYGLTILAGLLTVALQTLFLPRLETAYAAFADEIIRSHSALSNENQPKQALLDEPDL